MTVFKLPDLGEGLQEAEIVTWHVAEGDHVVADQPLLSVETDKAVVEIPAPVSGTISELIAKVGEMVPIGGPLVRISTGTSEDLGTVVGNLGASPEKTAGVKPGAESPADQATSRPQVTPAVRRLAREKHVDLTGLTGTGPGGTILSADVLAASAPLPQGEELHGVRLAMARKMAVSHANAVPATIMDHATIDTWCKHENPTLRLINAIVFACRKEPALNAWYDGERRRLHNQVDLAFAMDTAEGLFTPVLRDVGNMVDLPHKFSMLKSAVQNRTIAPEEMKNATISLSNFGTLGAKHAVMVIPVPQVAILGAGRIFESPAISGGQLVSSRRLPLSLTFDHRVVTGGEAARFLNAVKVDLEHASVGTWGGADE